MDKGLIKLSLLRNASPGGRAIPYLNVLIDNKRIGSIGGLFVSLDPKDNNGQKSFEITPGEHTICVLCVYDIWDFEERNS